MKDWLFFCTQRKINVSIRVSTIFGFSRQPAEQLPLRPGNTRQRYPSPTVNAQMDQVPAGYPVTCEIDGKMYRGTYWIAGKILTVSTGSSEMPATMKWSSTLTSTIARACFRFCVST